ncbi:50S ribosomal protein 6, chloroplastic isoform X3 [Rhodamnia argentea]|uniref:50S ribosomal protein 6, chloroplastic isoform X3 n=1 Tax=Rhodamnia argentea TaxID=178133 RepID=A0ABM3GZA2_9MYRT|nr:50S ribosomal protein 6, chloroplastic isoform X3 [Rhodamnia argentea]
MSISAIFGTRVPVAPSPPAGSASSKAAPRFAGGESISGAGMVSIIECSSRPQKKATAHHMKTRPRKTQAWDIRRKPTVYAPLPPLPPDWTLASSGGSDDADAASAARISHSELPPQALC